MKRALDAIAARAADHLRRERLREAFGRACRRGLPWLPAGALLVLLLRAAGAPIGAVEVLALAALPFAAAVAVRCAPALLAPVDRGAALGRVDQELGLHDRLRAADEFLARADRDGFREAAIADAAPYLEPARRLAFADRAARAEPGGPLAPTVAFLLVVAALLCTPGPSSAVPGEGTTVASRPDADTPSPDARPPAGRAVPPRPAPRPSNEPPSGAAREKEEAEAGGASDRMRRGSASSGRTARTGGSGAQARSADASGAPSAAGRASAQKLDTKPREPAPQKPRPPSIQPLPPRTPPPRDSGATSGSARSSGSSRNPTVSEWRTQDTPPEQADDPEADDQEVDDESEDSQTRGGVQPNLRSKKPPVNRELGIGFGNRSGQRSNGRGGASPRKKSRGTASLVLGVPVPDHVKGQPNPGMTKVTRERGEPEREKADGVRAGPRIRRSKPAGAVPHDELPPWLQEMVRRYFPREQDDEPE